MKRLRKILFSIIMVIILCAPVFALGACNKNKIINVTLEYTAHGCGYDAVYVNGGEYCDGFITSFVDDYENLSTTFKFKSGIKVDVAPLTRINKEYKIDKIYYLDKNSKEVVLYAYADGDYESNGDYFDNTWEANRNHNQWEQYFTMPNYDITIHIVSSQF